MKWFVVSEEELLDLASNAFADGVTAKEVKSDPNFRRRYLTACRARPVPAEAKGFYVIDENGDAKCLEINK